MKAKIAFLFEIHFHHLWEQTYNCLKNSWSTYMNYDKSTPIDFKYTDL